MTGCSCLTIVVVSSTVLEHGTIGETYNIGARCEKRNLDIVHLVCSMLDDLAPRRTADTLISFHS